MKIYSRLICVLFLLTSIGLHAQETTSQLVVATETFGDWVVRCERVDDDEKTCVMTHKVVDSSTGKEVLQANIAKTDEGTLMTIIFPLGVYLPEGAQLEVVDHLKRQFDILFCTANGCFVNELLDKELVEVLRKKDKAIITLYRRKDSPIQVPFSILGFFDAYKMI